MPLTSAHQYHINIQKFSYGGGASAKMLPIRTKMALHIEKKAPIWVKRPPAIRRKTLQKGPKMENK